MALAHSLPTAVVVPSAGSGGLDVVTADLPSGWAWWPRCLIVALCSGADDGDARGCHIPLEAVVAVLLPMPGLRVKIHVRPFGLSGGDALRCYPLGGIVVELRYLPAMSRDRLRAGLSSSSRPLRLRCRAVSVVPYLLHMTMSSVPLASLAHRQDRRTSDRSERAEGPLR